MAECGGILRVFTDFCRVCSGKYIGKTARPFRDRFNEHRNSIKNNDDKSALSVHVRMCKNISSIDDFKIDFISCVRDALEASLVESRFIDFYQPCLNRRHESVVASRIAIT